MELSDFQVGNRVELSPATDAWMMGDRFGEVVNVGRMLVWVEMDVSGKVRKLHPENIGSIIGDEPVTFALSQEAPYVPPKLTSTRYTAPKVTPRPNQNAKTRRMLRRNGPASVTRMFL